jgi:hypothetical protein
MIFGFFKKEFCGGLDMAGRGDLRCAPFSDEFTDPLCSLLGYLRNGDGGGCGRDA